MLKISLAEDPTGLRIAEWLKAHPPDGVTAVSVEALILKAKRFQGLVDHTVFPPRINVWQFVRRRTKRTSAVTSRPQHGITVGKQLDPKLSRAGSVSFNRLN